MRSFLLFLLISPILFSACRPDRSGAVAPERVPSPQFLGETPKGAMRTDGTGSYGGQLQLALTEEPTSFHPLYCNNNDLIDGSVFSHCWNYDLALQEGEPGLCESYERSEDGLDYLFTLREGLRWSDGEPVTAIDFEFTYRALIDPAMGETDREGFRQGDGKTYPRFELLDDRHFRFHLAMPDVMFLYRAGSMMVIPEHKFAKWYKEGKLADAFTPEMAQEDWVSSGPFVVKAIDQGKRVLLERNPYFWMIDKDGKRLPYLDRVEFSIIPDLAVTVQRFLDGNLDMIELRSEMYAQLKQREERDHLIVEDLGPGFTTNYLMFNLDGRKNREGRPYVDPVKLKWFQNVNFRRAIAHALDRESMVRIALQGKGQPLWSYYTSANKRWYNDRVVRYPYNPDLARQILLGEGFHQREGILYDPDNHPVRFRLSCPSENPTRIQFLNIIQKNLSQLGIELELLPKPFSELKQLLSNSRDFDAVILGWVAGVPPDPAQAKNVLLSSGNSHFWQPGLEKPATEKEAEIDRLMERCIQETDEDSRKEAFDQLQILFSEELPIIQLVVHDMLFTARPYVGALKPSLLPPMLYWNLEELYLTEIPEGRIEKMQ